MEPIRTPEADEHFLVSPFGKPWEHWLVLGFAAAAVVLLVVLGALVDPDPRGFGTHERLGLPSCKPMEWWNVPCPGCGVTTSIALAAHGHLWDAFVNQPFGLLTALALPAFSTWAFAGAVRGRNLASDLSRWRLGAWAIALVAVMVLSWLYKLALVRGWFG